MINNNVVISGLMTQSGLPPIGMFELAPVGIPVMVVGVLYMQFIGQHLIPNRPAPPTLTETFGLRPYLAELRIMPNSPLTGNTLSQSGFGQKFDLIVLAIIREGKRKFDPSANTKLQEGDTLLVEGPSEAILKFKDMAGIELQADAKFSDVDLEGDGLGLAEVVRLTRSPFIGRTPKNLQMRERYHLQVLAINRRTGFIRSVADTRRNGDVLLCEPRANYAPKMKRSMLGVMGAQRFNRWKPGSINFTGCCCWGFQVVIASVLWTCFRHPHIR
jgi:K+/H+ antiporter YhaU regulatory subunit KhtT